MASLSLIAPLRLLCLGAALLALSACQSLDAGRANPRVPQSLALSQLRPGDTLSITLLGVPDASLHPSQIDDAGFVNLPFIGQVQAAGKTAAELSQSVRQTYLDKRIYTAVDVAVTVTERFVYVGGEVARPGRISWAPDLTLTKAVQAAGGFSLYAKENRISLVRDKTAYDIDAALARQHPEEDPELAPGDSIQVPRSAF